MADQRNITYVEDDVVVYRASAIGACPTALVAARLGYEPAGTPDRVREVAEQGVELEVVALGHLMLAGWNIEDGQRLVEREDRLGSGQRVLVRGHVDSIGDPGDGHGLVVVEVKSRNHDTFRRVVARGWDAVPEQHQWQMSAYAHALGYRRVAYVAISRETGESHVLIADAPVAWETIVQRMEEVEEAVLWGELPTCHGRKDTWCNYYHLHQRAPFDPAHELADLARRYHDAAEAARSWTEEKDALRSPLLEALGDRTRVQAGDLTVELQGGKRLVVRPAQTN